MKKYLYLILLAAVLLSSCDKWMDLKPENGRLSETYWQKEEDVHNTIISCYTRMRDCLEKMVQWGEVRADVLVVKGNEDATKIQEQNITSDNGIVKWNCFYRMINSANAVIKYAPTILDKDPLFTEEKLNQYTAEAMFIRSLAYFYLVRSYREVPFITEPYITDDQSVFQPKSSEREILDQLIADLKWAMKYIPDSHSGWQTKGRGTKWAAMALLADIYLWDEKYTECIEVCNRLTRETRFSLMEDGEGYFKNFLTGLTTETIFELYYSNDQKQDSPLFDWFKVVDGKYYISMQTAEEFKSPSGAYEDIRGQYATWRLVDGSYFIWKYVGALYSATNDSRREKHDANWVIYRLAEIYLMKAEACVMAAGPNAENYEAAREALNVVRQRAQVDELSESEAAALSEEEFLKLIMTERKKEFMGEGKRWYDMVRMAKKENFTKYKDWIVTLLLEKVSVLERPLYEMRLAKDWSFYFPIHKDEIDQGKGVLVQNPVYQN